MTLKEEAAIDWLRDLPDLVQLPKAQLVQRSNGVLGAFKRVGRHFRDLRAWALRPLPPLESIPGALIFSAAVTTGIFTGWLLIGLERMF